MKQGKKVSLGKFIATRRKYLRYTQEQLAEVINVSKSAIAKWETDGGIPDRDNLRELSGALGVSLDELYRLADDKSAVVNPVINITADVIAMLESHGYVVIAPNENEEEKDA